MAVVGPRDAAVVPQMGWLGLTVRGILTGNNLVSWLLTILFLNMPLVALVDVLFSVSCVGGVSSIGVLGNILWLLTQIILGPLLWILQLRSLLANVINSAFMADCS